MNNKQLGTKFEHTLCEKLNQSGWWVHFCTPNHSGAQPCDIIACKNGVTVLIDCKTLSANVKSFPKSRAEFNQLYSMSKFEQCGNGAGRCFFAIQHCDNVYMLPLSQVVNNNGKTSIKLTEVLLFENWETIWNIIWTKKST